MNTHGFDGISEYCKFVEGTRRQGRSRCRILQYQSVKKGDVALDQKGFGVRWLLWRCSGNTMDRFRQQQRSDGAMRLRGLAVQHTSTTTSSEGQSALQLQVKLSLHLALALHLLIILSLPQTLFHDHTMRAILVPTSDRPN